MYILDATVSNSRGMKPHSEFGMVVCADRCIAICIRGWRSTRDAFITMLTLILLLRTIPFALVPVYVALVPPVGIDDADA